MNTKMFLLRIFFPVFFTALILTGCNKDEEEDKTPQQLIVGTWTVGTQTYSVMIGGKTFTQWLIDEMGLSQTEAQMYEDMMNQEIDDQYGSSTGTIAIKSDNKYVVNIDGDTDSGTWSMSADGKKLTIDSVDGDPVVFDVVSLTSSKLAVKMTQTTSEDLNDDAVPENMVISITMNFTK